MISDAKTGRFMPQIGYSTSGLMHWYPSHFACMKVGGQDDVEVTEYITSREDESPNTLHVITEQGRYKVVWNNVARKFVGIAGNNDLIEMDAAVTYGAYTLGAAVGVLGDVVGFTHSLRGTVATSERLMYKMNDVDRGGLRVVGVKYYNSDGEMLKDAFVRRDEKVFAINIESRHADFRDGDRISKFYCTVVEGVWHVAPAEFVDPGLNGDADPAMWLLASVGTIPDPIFEEGPNGVAEQRGDIIFNNQERVSHQS